MKRGGYLNKKDLLIGTGIIIIIVILFGLIKIKKLNLQSNTFCYIIGTYYSDNVEVNRKIIKKDDINKVIDYLNSLVLIKSNKRPKDASIFINFNDNNNNTIYSITIGPSSHILWLGNNRYDFDESKIKHLIDMLNSIGENSSEGYFD